MAEHTPTPWRVEDGTDLIWGACDQDDHSTYGMGYPICEGKLGYWGDRRADRGERDANAAFIVKAVNSHEALVKALRDIIEANNDFRKAMPEKWDGDPLQDAIDSAAKLLLADDVGTRGMP
jgi:hypothetical protein